MKRVIAAVDNSPAARAVARAAVLVSDLLGGELEVLHVREDGDEVARHAARGVGMELTELRGVPARTLIDAAERPDVVAVVVGVRGIPGGRQPAGSTAVRLITAVNKLVVVVPPTLPDPYRLRRVLVPLEARAATATALRDVLGCICERDVEVVVLNVMEAQAIPPFTNHVGYETEAWVDQFVGSYCPGARNRFRIELRAGSPPEEVIAEATGLSADLIVLAWSQDLSRRAAVVRAVLRRSSVPVLLVPVERPATGHQGAGEVGRVSVPAGPTSD